MIEIERKFLLTSQAFKKEAVSKKHITQGFLNTHPERTVRVRIKEDVGFLTIKGISSKDGTSRFEWEKEISIEEAKALLALCENHIIEKYRYEVPFKGFVFEVDEFLGVHKGLLIAEIELENANQHFEKPFWLGKEVTGEKAYYNSQIRKNNY